MGLQIWLPLRDNLENKGLANITVAQANTTIDTNGKIGSCYSFNGTNSGFTIYDAPQISNWTESTVCFWIKDAPTGKTQCIINHRSVAGKGLAVFLISNKIRVDTDNSQTIFSDTYDFSEWTHIAIVSKGTERKIYMNGDLLETKTASEVSYTSSGSYASIGASSVNTTAFTGNWLQGLLNDFRLYDEALSPMQIKIISQGLVAHYLLNNNGSGLPNYFRNSNFSTGITTGWGGVNGSVISIEEIDGKRTITATKGTTNYIVRPFISDYEYVANTDISFMISADVYVTETGTINIGQWISTSEVSGWQAMTGSVTWLTPNDLSVGWNHIIYKATKRNSYNGSIIIAFSYTGTTFYLTNLKFEFSDKPTPWCPNSTDAIYTRLGYNNNIEYDVSGYCNNGTKYNITDYTSDTPRYSVATKFDSNAKSYINVGRGGMVKDEITINIWAYMDDWTTYNSRLISCTEGGGWNFEASSSKIHFAIGTGTTSNAYKNTSGYALSELSSGWHMFTGTYNGLVVNQYVDGVFNTSNNAYTAKTPIHYHSSNPIIIGAEASATSVAGSYFNGNLSDVRIYATALSESDIQSLYKNSAFVDSSGNVYATEYVES